MSTTSAADKQRSGLYNEEKMYHSHLKTTLSSHIFPTPLLQHVRKASIITSTVIGFHHQVYLRYLYSKDKRYEETAKKFKQFRYMYDRPRLKLALKGLNHLCLTVITDLNLNYSGPYDLKPTIKALADYFKCQINVFKNGGTQLHFKYPEMYDISRAEVNILLSDFEGIIKADYIRNLSKYLKEASLNFCPLCIKIYNNNYHRCFHSRRCYACHKIKVYVHEAQDLFRTSINQDHFCIRVTEAKCDRCDTIYFSPSCFKKHVKIKHCLEMKRCNSCKKVYRHQKNAQHVCNETELCRVCYISYAPEKPHYCQMEKQKPPSKNRSAICCWDVESKVRSSHSYCKDCFLQEFDYLAQKGKIRSQLNTEERRYLLCEKHKNEGLENKSYHEINFIGNLKLYK